MQTRAWVGFGVSLVASLVWWSCSNSSAGGGGVADAGEAGDDASDASVEGPECNPCFQYCACTPGETLYSASQCMTYTCPPNGVWGAMGCTGPSMCADASEEGPAAMDAATDAGAEAASDARGDAPSDALSDAPSDAVNEAAEASGD